MAKKIDKSLQIESRAAWTNKGRDHDANFQPKCRIVGKGFQEKYDEKLRRDSPTRSPFMQNLPCSIAACKRFSCYTGDATGAFLQGVKIERGLYLKMPRNLQGMSIPGIEEGSLLKLNKSIYGTNDAAKAWYRRIVQSLRDIGFEQLQFETAAFKLMNQGKLVRLLCLRVDDMLMAFDMENNKELCDH
eukprot:4953820-Pyramimonas_sp.AAC.1